MEEDFTLQRLYKQNKVQQKRIKELGNALKIFTRPANYESSGIRPPCCDAMVRIAKQVLEGDT